MLLKDLLLAVFFSSCMASIAKLSTTTAVQRTIVWFRNDLRIHDNPVLSSAALRNSKDTVCIYCFDPRHYAVTKFGSLKTGLYRARFLIESVSNLRKNLRSLGQELIVAHEAPEVCIPRLLEGLPECQVFVQGEVTSEELSAERRVEEQIRPRGGQLIRIYGGSTLYHPEDLPYSKSLGDYPDVFTIFREKVEKSCSVRPLLPTVQPGQLGPMPQTESFRQLLGERCNERFLPAAASLCAGLAEAERGVEGSQEADKRAVMNFEGGEDAALRRVQDWMFVGDRLKEYFEIRNGMLGEAYSSKLSPWLALGCISPRYIQQSVKRYERERKISNKSTYWLLFELIWRDFFRFLCAKYGSRVFRVGGAKGVQRSWSSDSEKIRRWKMGLTGQPLVDANMRELLLTGWMSNRGRQNVASYLVLDLGVDWRVGADHFESLLLDHDVCSNYGNWNAAAGLTGGRLNKFNIVKQSKDYDINGDYIKHWLPELRLVPADKLFQPWLLTAEEQARYSVRIGPGLDYPAPDVTPYRAVSGITSGESGGPMEKGTRNTRPDKPKKDPYAKGGVSSSSAVGAVSESIVPTADSTSSSTSSGSLGKEGTNRKFKRVQHF